MMAKINKKKGPAKMAKKKILKPVKQKKILLKKNKPVQKEKKKIIVAKKIAVRKVIKDKVVSKKKTVAKNVINKTKKPTVAIKRKKAKTVKKSEIKEFAAESLFKARIKVIGIGGGGGSIVSEIGRSLEKANFVVADTDMRALKRKSGIKYF